MIVGNLPHHNSQQPEARDHSFDKNTYPYHLMNKSPKAHPTMTPVHEETEDKVMTKVTPMTIGTNSTQTTACLVEKLKKLMTMESTNGTMTPTAMDIDMEEMKKHT